jgi:hypothetical protein
MDRGLADGDGGDYTSVDRVSIVQPRLRVQDGELIYPYVQPSIAEKMTAPMSQKEMSDIALHMRSSI